MNHPPPPRPEQRWWLSAFLASRQPRLMLLVLLAVAVMDPREGLGYELCGVKRLTGAPCPGCGVTRSGTNLLRGDVRRAFNFNPFGLILHPILIGLCAFSVLPGALRRAFALKLLPWQRVVNTTNIAFWSVFFLFGAVRWLLVMAHLLTFPPEWL